LEDIGSGALGHVLSFLNAKDLASAASVNPPLHNLVHNFGWNDLDWRIGSEGRASGEAKNAKERCRRFFQAQQYAEKMEQLASQHYDFANSSRALVNRFSSTSNFPSTLHTRVFRFVDTYEYFVRISNLNLEATNPSSTRRMKAGACVGHWEGFLKASKTSYNEICLDLSVLQWNNATSRNPSVCPNPSQSESQALFPGTMVTVVALEKTSSSICSPSLVVSSGGVESIRNEDIQWSVCRDDDSLSSYSEEQVYRINPRNVRSRGIRNDEDWIGVEIRSALSELCCDLGLHEHKFTSIVLSHQW